jgi:predicted mannosyl-3-phosphoglycerate phosphatase (HAD superfamily)
MTARLAAEVKALDAERARLVRLQREAAALAYRRRSETLSRHSEAEIRARNSRVLEEAGLVQFGGDRHIIGSFRAELDALKREGGKG